MALPSYAPRLRTALVLSGAGTAGAYHAGVLRALAEAGIKVDVIAAHGAGVLNALGGAVDTGGRLWAPDGPWTDPRLGLSYRWRAALRTGAVALLMACALMLSPLLVLAVATGVYALSMLASLASFPSIAERFLGAYSAMVGWLFDPPILPTVVPRLVVLVLLVMTTVLVMAWWRARAGRPSRRKAHGAFWWALLGHPLDPAQPEGLALETAWRLTPSGTAAVPKDQQEIGRKYVELAAENFGQPGFREVLLGVHDLDARRDIVLGIVSPAWHAAFGARRVGAGAREAEALELSAAPEGDRGLVVDALRASLRVPAVCAPHEVEWPVAGYWRGERHRWCDRPELTGRLLDEVARLGVEQVVLVSAAPPAGLPHELRPRPVDMRARAGEAWRSIETAAFQDAWSAAASRFSGVFAIRPDHNPIGPFECAGAYDDSSDRQRTIAELLQQGYDDTYRQFIEPVVATGERIEP